jgi:hypothetical protein
MNTVHVCDYRGWGIFKVPTNGVVDGYFLIAESGDDDFMQKPFTGTKDAKRFIDRLHDEAAQQAVQPPLATTYSGIFMELIHRPVFWFNPAIMFFVIAAYVGTFIGKRQSTLGEDLVKTTFSLAMCYFLMGVVWSFLSWLRRQHEMNKSQYMPPPVHVPRPDGGMDSYHNYGRRPTRPSQPERRPPMQPGSVDME